MISLSRRQLARYAADQLLAGVSVRLIARHLGAILVQSKRTKELDLLMRDIDFELEYRGKSAQADVTSASVLPDALQRELVAFIKKAGAVDQVTLNTKIDETVLGGLRVETAVHSWDKTVTRALSDIRETI